MGGSFKIGRFSGIDVKVHWTFFLLLAFFAFIGCQASGSLVRALTATVIIVSVDLLCVVARVWTLPRSSAPGHRDSQEAPLATPSTSTVRSTAVSGRGPHLERDMRLYPEASCPTVHGRSAKQQWPWRLWSTENTSEHASCCVGEARQPRLASAETRRLTGKMTTGGVSTRSLASCARRYRL
jgi:hypothetical protein